MHYRAYKKSKFLFSVFILGMLLASYTANSTDLTSEYNVSLQITANSDDTYNIKITSATNPRQMPIRNCYGGCYINLREDTLGVIGKEKIKGTFLNSLFPYEIAKKITGKTFSKINFKGESRYNLHVEFLSDEDTDILKNATGLLPPLTARCTLDQGSYLLQHNQLVANALNGNVSSLPVNISCNRPSTVKVTALNGLGTSSDISLDQGLISSLKIDGSDGKTGVTINNQKKISFNLSSTLKSQGLVKTGDYQGSGILKIDFQ